MTRELDDAVSRRQWLGQVSLPAAAVSLGAAPALNAAPRGNDLGARTYNVRDFGAKGDGVTLDTAAVQAAIDACGRDRGGTVLVPAGDFVVGTLELKSDVTLHLAARGRLLGSARPQDYRAGNGVPESNGNIVLLSAANARNVAIEGQGTIDGNGAKFFTGHGDNTGPGQNSAQGYFQRPHLLVFYKVENLRVRDVFLTASAYHGVRILQCRDVTLDGVRVYNRVIHNNDGFHINSSEYVHIANCDVRCQDDACALFGSNKWVTVTNCTFSTRWSVFRFGGGEAENVTISNCVIYDTYGCPVKMRCGAGSRFENITFSNLVLRGVTGPISIGLDSGYQRRADQPPRAPGVVRNVAFNGIRATVVAQGKQHPDLPWPQSFRPGETRTCIVLNGVGAERLEEISFTDVHVTYEGGGTAAEAARDVPQLAGEYFEIGTPPSWALYARGVRGLTLHNVRFRAASPDERPALVLDHVEDAAVNGLTTQGTVAQAPVLRAVESRDVLLTAPRVLSPASALVQVEGVGSARIRIDGGDVTRAATPATFARGAVPQSVVLRT